MIQCLKHRVPASPFVDQAGIGGLKEPSSRQSRLHSGRIEVCRPDVPRHCTLVSKSFRCRPRIGDYVRARLLIAAQNGAAMVRVHDVAETVQALKVWRATQA